MSSRSLKVSGAERRKREKQKEAAQSELLKKVPKLNTYFSAPHASAASRMSATLEQSEEGQGITKEVSWQQDDDQNTGTHSHTEQLMEAEPTFCAEDAAAERTGVRS